MPVTIRPSKNEAEPWPSNQTLSRYPHATSDEQLLQLITTDENGGAYRKALGWPGRSGEMVQSSFDRLSRDSSTLFACKNGLVFAAFEAYNEHHNLVIRPDDVWLTILTQLSIYVNTNAEELRHLFVAHEGQQHLHIEVDLAGIDHGKMAFEMTKLMAAGMKDATLRDWVLPAFSTTEKVDQAVAAITFMGTMQKYFTYSWGTRCGIPEVTLLGNADDWVEIRSRCESRLGKGGFGPQAQRWWRVLKPVLDGFVASFEDPEGRAARKFWAAICNVHQPNGSGTTTYTGWITAFCYWDEKGECLHETMARGSVLGGKALHLNRSQFPMGFTKVPVTLVNGGIKTPTEMLAGLVAINASKSGKTRPAKSGEGRARWEGYDTIQPEAGWFMYTCAPGQGHLSSTGLPI